MKLLADDTSLFSIVQNKNTSVSQLDNDLDKVSDCAYTWKMSSNSDAARFIKSLDSSETSPVNLQDKFLLPFIRHYGDIVYDKPNNETFINKIEKAQYDAALAITAAIRGTCREKLYAELVFQSLKFRRWFRKLASFYKIQSIGLPKYLLQ